MKQVVIVGLSLICVARIAMAQGEPSRPDSATTKLKPMVVTGTKNAVSGYRSWGSRTGTKTETPLNDTPQSISVISRSLITDQAMQSMADVIRYIPGVSMGQGEGHRDQPTIRGNSSTADFFVDGFRDDAQYFRDLYNAEQIESLRGSNAMIFGRGGAGGVINRRTKEAGTTIRSASVEGGSADHKRATLDLGQRWNTAAAGRLNGVYENSGTFRNRVRLRRYGANPTVNFLPDHGPQISVGYEHFNDHRTVDRGIPSFAGAPAAAGLRTFFGHPDSSYSNALVNAASANAEQRFTSSLTVRNRSRAVRYDKFYQNIYPGAVNASGTQVAMSGYNNRTRRTNLINQSEAVFGGKRLGAWHTVLAGMEVGHQTSDNLRHTAYFNGGSATSLTADFGQPTLSAPVAFRPAASDADNHVVVRTGAIYLQDQLTLSRRWQAILGLRAERFDIAVRNNRDASNLSRIDGMVSPRTGLVFKPVEPLSLYTSYSVSHLPSSGDQFSSLTATTQTLRPERFTNSEAGLKWDPTPLLSVTGAGYRLDRTKSSAKDPNDPTRTVQTGAQRTTGVELSLTGAISSRWEAVATYTAQRARVVQTTSSARAGATTPLVPSRVMALWNKYRLSRAWAIGVGATRQNDSFAAIDNTVTLPGFTRIDGALYANLLPRTRLQVNVENALNIRYYATANGNNNISPGAPRTVRLAIAVR